MTDDRAPATRRLAPSRERQRANRRVTGKLASPGFGDVETLVYWVLMQATKDMEEDLRRILGELEHTDKATAALRTPIHELSGLHQEFAAFVREEFARGDRPVAGGIPTWV